MRVLIDGQIFRLHRYGGISRCFCELIRHMPKQIKVTVGILQSENVHLQELRATTSIEGFDFHRLWAKRNLWLHSKKRTNDLYFRNLLHGGAFDVLHPTYFFPDFLDDAGTIPFVMTIHDMIPEKFPEYFSPDDPQILGRRKLVPRAAHFVAVSQNTKEDFMEIYGVPDERITVIHHGAMPQKKQEEVRELPHTPYILYVGERIGYKNFSLFVREVAPLLQRQPSMKVVCTGPDFTESELRQISGMGLEGRLVHIFAKNDGQLATIYSKATAFVYPSAYEGFGLPILEAWQAGCPVILNRASCFPEVAGEAAVYFETDGETSNLGEKINELCAWTDEQRADHIALGRQRLELYSWQEAAAKLANVYKQVVDNNR